MGKSKKIVRNPTKNKRKKLDYSPSTLRRSVIVPRGPNNESRGGPSGHGASFCGPGGGFLVLVDVVACHYVYYH